MLNCVVSYWMGDEELEIEPRKFHGILKYCCDDMRARVANGVIGDRKWGRVFPVDGLAIHGFNADNTPLELPIKHCPACGAKIEVVYQGNGGTDQKTITHLMYGD
jgi:hypothetical protein